MKVRLQHVISNINLPTVIKTAILPNESVERLFVATQIGEIFYIKNGIAETFLDIRSQVINPLFNTRPITFYNADNHELQFPVRRSDSGCDGGQKSCVFRVECVSNNSCQCRVLVEEQSKCGRPKYNSTDSFVTIRLCDIASCRCLPDTFIDLCIR